MPHYPANYAPALAAQDTLAVRLRDRAEVLGLAVRPGLVLVYADSNIPIPSTVDGVPTELVVVDHPRTQPAIATPDHIAAPEHSDAQLRMRQRPVFGGCSVGHRNAAAGTVATVCRGIGADDRCYLLSTNHVLAISNRYTGPSQVLQPGPVDGGTVEHDVIGRLARLVPLRFGAQSQQRPNLVDAAVVAVPSDLVDERIAHLDALSGINDAPTVGLAVAKTGRTTGHTEGVLAAVNGLLRITVRRQPAWFAGQLLVAIEVGPGDSGSLVVDADGRAVGLLSAAMTGHAIVNPITDVTRALAIRLTVRPPV